jgi:hypothetical protein
MILFLIPVVPIMKLPGSSDLLQSPEAVQYIHSDETRFIHRDMEDRRLLLLGSNCSFSFLLYSRILRQFFNDSFSAESSNTSTGPAPFAS